MTFSLFGLLALGCTSSTPGTRGLSGAALDSGVNSNPSVTGQGGSQQVAAAPQQPTELGTVGQGMALVLIEVTRPSDGLVTNATNWLSDDTHCPTDKNNSVPSLFPDEQRPQVFPSHYEGAMPANRCGQVQIMCDLSSSNTFTLKASYTDNGLVYGTDPQKEVKVDCVEKGVTCPSDYTLEQCNKLVYSPIVLTLIPMFSRTNQDYPNNSPSQSNSLSTFIQK